MTAGAGEGSVFDYATYLELAKICAINVRRYLNTSLALDRLNLQFHIHRSWMYHPILLIRHKNPIPRARRNSISNARIRRLGDFHLLYQPIRSDQEF